MIFRSAAMAVAAMLAVSGGAAYGQGAPQSLINPKQRYAPRGPLGIWLTADGHGVVEIAPCGQALCGWIVGIDRAPGTPMPTDVHGRSQCKLPIITNEKPDGEGTWLGQITDPRDGTTYHAKLWVDDRDNLHLRGFIGMPLLGQTQIWRRYTGRLTAECGLA